MFVLRGSPDALEGRHFEDDFQIFTITDTEYLLAGNGGDLFLPGVACSLGDDITKQVGMWPGPIRRSHLNRITYQSRTETRKLSWLPGVLIHVSLLVQNSKLSAVMGICRDYFMRVYQGPFLHLLLLNSDHSSVSITPRKQIQTC